MHKRVKITTGHCNFGIKACNFRETAHIKTQAITFFT